MFRAAAIVLPLTALSQSAKIARPSFVGQGDVDETLTRSYKNFQEIMDIYLGHFNQNGGSIPNTRTNSEDPASVYHFWAYGCYCLPVSGAPMSAGYGKPVDEIDMTCYQRKKCVACLDMMFPDEDGCSTEEVQYRYSNRTVNGEPVVTCTNRLGTCQRASCECDLELAKNLHQTLRARTGDYNMDNHLFYGRFDRGVQCQRSVEGDGPLDACCRKPGGYATAYHSARQECCSDGSVMSTGTCGI